MTPTEPHQATAPSTSDALRPVAQLVPITEMGVRPPAARRGRRVGILVGLCVAAVGLAVAAVAGAGWAAPGDPTTPAPPPSSAEASMPPGVTPCPTFDPADPVCFLPVPTSGAPASPSPSPPASLPPSPPVSGSAAPSSSCVPGLPGCIAPGPPVSQDPLLPPEDDSGGILGWIIDGILAAINFFFESLVMAALNPLLDLLGRTVLATPGIEDMPRVAEIWDGTRLIVVAGYVILVLVAGVIVMSHETVQTRHSWKELLPRVAVGFIAANMSLLVAGTAIDLVNALSGAVMGSGVDPGETADALTAMVTGAIGGAGGIFIIFIALVIAVMIVALLVTYVVRVALTVVLIVAAPLALACHALPQTDGVARWWWRAFFAVLAIQLGQSLVLITALRVFFDPGGFGLFGLPTADGLVNLVVTIALLWILIKLPFWVWSSVSVGGRSMLGSAVKGLIAYKTLGAVGLGRGRSGKTRGGNSRSGDNRRGSSTSASAADPYARVRSDRDGQFLLPFPITRVPRTASSPTVAMATGAGRSGRRRARGVQLSLPLNNPSTLTPDRVDRRGQYELPIDVTRVPKPPAPVPAPPARRRTRARQPQLPFDPYVPPRADRGGQYVMPIEVPRVPRPPQPPVVMNPAVRRRPPARQPQLPFDPPDPYCGSRPTAAGQYTLPLGVRRAPKPPTPPPAPAAGSGRGSTGGPRARQLPLPLDPKPRRQPRPPGPPRPPTRPPTSLAATPPASEASGGAAEQDDSPPPAAQPPRAAGARSSRARRRRKRPPSTGETQS